MLNNQFDGNKVLHLEFPRNMAETAHFDPSVLGSAMITADEDVFALIPALAAPCIFPTTEEVNTLSRSVELLGQSHEVLGKPAFPSNHDENPFLNDVEVGSDTDVQKLLPDLPGHEPHQVTIISAEAAPKLVQQITNFSNDSTRYSPVDLSHENSTARLTSDREALFPPTNSPGCVVTIHNLPIDISIQDILARIRGGEIRTATLVNLKNTTCAVITFKTARSAQLFFHVSESFNDIIWTFGGQEEDAEPTTAQIAYIPILETGKLLNNPANIPLEPRLSMEVDLGTRCIAITRCSFQLIEGIWNTFRLTEKLRSPHYANQFEDVWLDDFERGRGGRIEYATLHIWYTNTNMAIGARQRAFGRHWAGNLQFEADPCNDSPSVLFFRSSNDAGFAWHSNPNHSLLNVYKAGCISELFRTWNEISEAVRGAYANVSQPKGQPDLLPSEDMAVRRETALSNGGFDPVTLMSMSSQDYDSDNEGCRGPPRLDTRKIKPLQTPTQKTALPSRNACLSVLETLAARALSTYFYSPGTPTAMSTVDTELEDEKPYPVGLLQEFSEIASGESFSSSDLQSDEIEESNSLARNNPKKGWADTEEKFTNLRKILTEPTHWYTVSLAEFLACNEQQHKAMGTMFYVPPEGHNSLQKYPWNEDLPPQSDERVQQPKHVFSQGIQG